VIVSNAQPLGIAHFTVIDVPPLELARLAAKIGYGAIGLRLHPAFPGAPFYELPSGSGSSREMQSCLRDEGIGVYDIEFVVIGTDFSPVLLKATLESANALGAKRLSVCGDDADWSRLVENFSALCDLAAQFGMGVDLECMPWRSVSSIPLALRLVQASGRPNGGVLIDALHLSRSGGSPQTVSVVPPHLIQSAQICDARAKRPRTNDEIILEARSQRLLPGEGTLPLREMIAVLPDHTVLSVEVPNSGLDAEDHARRVYDAAQRTLAPQSERSVTH
jgi:sugar phosphate isomerase/epimerase